MNRFEYDERYNNIIDKHDYKYTLAEYEPKRYNADNMDELTDLINHLHNDLIRAHAKLRAAGLQKDEW